MPLSIGFIVQNYMAIQLPGAEAGTPAFTTTRQSSGGGDSESLSVSRRSHVQRDGRGREEGRGGGGARGDSTEDVTEQLSPRLGGGILRKGNSPR